MAPFTIPQRIARNRKIFDRMVDVAVATRRVDRRIQLCAQAMHFAVQNPSGIYNSQKLETSLTSLAASHNCPLAAHVRTGHVLHVLSRTYASGGHTRVVERWIQAAPPEEPTHDIVLLSQGDRPIPHSLAHSERGSLIHLKDGYHLEKALELRQLASSYDYIVLHTHMHDPIPLLAFATADFKRPVLLYNHADHLPWFGCTIADLIINNRSLTRSINSDFRHLSNTFILPLPVEAPPPLSRDEAKQAFGLSPSTKVILSIAAPYKYTPHQNLNFATTLAQILDNSPETVAFIIGPTKSDTPFQKSHPRIHPLGTIPYKNLAPYIATADLAIESFPLGSTTAILDIARHGIPCLTLTTATNGYDAFSIAQISCQTTAELSDKALTELNTPTPNNLLPILKAESFPHGFQSQLQRLRKHIPPQHKVHAVTQDTHTEITPFETIISTNLMNNTTLKKRMAKFTRRIVYLYTRFAFPYGLTKWIYRKLNSYSYF